MNGIAPRKIWLCADDYGISPGVNRGIRELIEQGRLNATSVMVVGPAIGRNEASALHDAVARNRNCAIGLHATLTAPFHPITMHYRPLRDEQFLPLGKTLQASLLRKLDPEMIRAELAAQIATFTKLLGRAPDYIDGHQHVQVFPQVRDAFLAAAKAHAPGAWVRQSGRVQPLSQRLNTPKALLLDTLSATFRKRAARAGVAFNPGFAGAYDFTKQLEFGALMAGFLDGLPDGGLVMCHPGHVDEILVSLDPFTDQREREYAYLAGDDFPRLLDANKVTLAR
ncbi:MAG: YdjC-like protein [Tardiphaga sp.]|uniref:ChbG/HpnK family deacetylase n=1 Tax=Tardiphaga sp. TaxID=1926292 RepID=UPI0026232D77|nr:ChbG/HpnK family deacetylase [Tardiphaga sp.]MDB5500254.1 YdjC-like protein [Tardiphaga sp.]